MPKAPGSAAKRFSAADVMIGLDLHFGIDIFKLVSQRPPPRAYADRYFARPVLQRASRSRRREFEWVKIAEHPGTTAAGRARMTGRE